jgi:hypothetical protein
MGASSANSWVVSVDLPWSASGFVGAASAERDGNKTSVYVATAPCREESLPNDVPECDDFIQHGAARATLIAADASAPSLLTPAARLTYLRALYGGLIDALAQVGVPANGATRLGAIDIPLVPQHVAASVSPRHGTKSTRRPVERAFEKKVRFKPAGFAAFDFCVPQSGVVLGWRPGYAVAELVERLTGCETVFECFPQLSIGALAELTWPNASAVGSLAGHKGSLKSTAAITARDVLLARICNWLGVTPSWTLGSVHGAGGADGLDALLGLLPLAAERGVVSGTGRQWSAVMLKNASHGLLPLPEKAGPAGAKVLRGARPWIESPMQKRGIVDEGILALDLDAWL